MSETEWSVLQEIQTKASSHETASGGVAPILNSWGLLSHSLFLLFLDLLSPEVIVPIRVQSIERSLRGVVAIVLDCDFELQSRDNVHLRINKLEKVINAFIFPAVS